jgi:hypothetical protein
LHVTRYGRPSGWRRSCGGLALGQILALLLLAPRAAAAAISAGPTIEVPWMQSVDDFAEVTAAVLADGSFAIASTEVFEPAPQEFTVRLQAQFFRATGGALTRPLVLIRPPGVVSYAGVGSLGTRYFLVWQDSKRAHAAFYSEQGTLLGQPFPWPASDIPDFAAYYRFGNAPLWRFLPITYDFAGLYLDVPYYRIFLRAAQPSGALLGPPVELAPHVLSDLEAAAINGSGWFVVLSTRCAMPPPMVLPCVRGIQIFADAVTPRTPLITADVPQEVGNGGFTAGIGPQGQVLLTWVTDLDQPAPRFVARLYDRHGSPASEELQVVTPAAPGLSPLKRGMKALDDGSFVLSWLLHSQVTNTATLFVDRFDPKTKTFEEPVALAEGLITNAVLELNGAGRGVVVWQTQEVDAEGGLISNAGHLRVLLANR